MRSWIAECGRVACCQPKGHTHKDPEFRKAEKRVLYKLWYAKNKERILAKRSIEKRFRYRTDEVYREKQLEPKRQRRGRARKYQTSSSI